MSIKNVKSSIDELLIVKVLKINKSKYDIYEQLTVLSYSVPKRTSFLLFSPEEVANMEYQRVQARGSYDHTKEIYIGPRSNFILLAA